MVGGCNDGYQINQCFVIDFDDISYSNFASLVVNRNNPGLILKSNKIYAFSGSNFTGEDSKSIEYYDFSTKDQKFTLLEISNSFLLLNEPYLIPF